MALLKDYYNTGHDAQVILPINDTYDYYAQTFTTTSKYKITSVKVLIRVGSLAGDWIDVSIRATSGGLPTGSDLVVKRRTDLPSDSAEHWLEFTFDTPLQLDDATKYAIVIRSQCANGSSYYMKWQYDSSSPTYSGGAYCKYTSSWTETTAYDFMFETWGVSGSNAAKLLLMSN